MYAAHERIPFDGLTLERVSEYIVNQPTVYGQSLSATYTPYVSIMDSHPQDSFCERYASLVLCFYNTNDVQSGIPLFPDMFNPPPSTVTGNPLILCEMLAFHKPKVGSGDVFPDTFDEYSQRKHHRFTFICNELVRIKVPKSTIIPSNLSGRFEIRDPDLIRALTLKIECCMYGNRALDNHGSKHQSVGEMHSDIAWFYTNIAREKYPRIGRMIKYFLDMFHDYRRYTTKPQFFFLVLVECDVFPHAVRNYSTNVNPQSKEWDLSYNDLYEILFKTHLKCMDPKIKNSDLMERRVQAPKIGTYLLTKYLSTEER